ncbi:uncharacterized protein BDV17DRAFT_292488 [Aspergillus undulatus]|uniref:uncharacterized protein n=1 Tax=Aspergillus undulatus TaxID=1810928 RepID=UPI003CCE15A1
MNPQREIKDEQNNLLEAAQSNDNLECSFSIRPYRAHDRPLTTINRFWWPILFIFATSLTLNIINLGLALKLQALKQQQQQQQQTCNEPNTPTETLSPFANLPRNISTPYVLLTDYASPNTSISSPLWSSINIDAGVIALDDTYAATHNLRTAQRFPWDTNKGIYILHGFHNLHCLKIIHISLTEFQSGQAQSRSWHHISHCMDALRRQILCDADDTPRATERRKEVLSGVGQYRMCRDWGKLVEFAERHTACYKRPLNGDDELPVIERFKHCPDGSGYVVDENYVPSEEIVVGLPEENVALGEGA